jgi:hypothetical protein
MWYEYLGIGIAFLFVGGSLAFVLYLFVYILFGKGDDFTRGFHDELRYYEMYGHPWPKEYEDKVMKGGKDATERNTKTRPKERRASSHPW